MESKSMENTIIEGSNLPDEKVEVKASVCQKCNGIVRVAIAHMMSTKSKNEFMREVMKYDLSVKTIPLLEYRNNKPEWCKCKIDSSHPQND